MIAILGYVLLALMLGLAAVLAIAATRPDRFHVARTKRIAAAPEHLFPMINDLRQMNTWNPFALREIGGRGDYSGPTTGKGAKFTFDGRKSGTGQIEILDTVAPSKVVMRLAMMKPIKADNTVEFMLKLEGSATDVTWAMSGRQPLIGKAMTLFVDCDKMVGREFEQGLANLKAIAEKA